MHFFDFCNFPFSNNFLPQDMSYSFAFCTSLISVDNFPFSTYVRNMNDLFYDCRSYPEIAVSSNIHISNTSQIALNTTNLIDIIKCFQDALL